MDDGAQVGSVICHGLATTPPGAPPSCMSQTAALQHWVVVPARLVAKSALGWRTKDMPHLVHTPSCTHQTAANEYCNQIDCDGQVGGVICHGRSKGADSTWGTTFLLKRQQH